MEITDIETSSNILCMCLPPEPWILPDLCFMGSGKWSLNPGTADREDISHLGLGKGVCIVWLFSILNCDQLPLASTSGQCDSNFGAAINIEMQMSVFQLALAPLVERILPQGSDCCALL